MKKKSTKKTNNNILENIKSFWRGEWSLLQTFWGFFIVGNTVVGIIVLLLLDTLDLNNSFQIFPLGVPNTSTVPTKSFPLKCISITLCDVFCKLTTDESGWSNSPSALFC